MKSQQHPKLHFKQENEPNSTCDELLDETIDGNADRVAELIELAHDTYTSVLKYNDETFYDM